MDILAPEHCGLIAQRKGDRWLCTGHACGAWKWVKPRDERNSWRAASCLPNLDRRRDVLKLLPNGLELHTAQLVNFLACSHGTVIGLLQAMEADGVLEHRYLAVDREHTIRRQVCLWRSTGLEIPENPTPVARRGPEPERMPLYSFDALVMAMGAK